MRRIGARPIAVAGHGRGHDSELRLGIAGLGTVGASVVRMIERTADRAACALLPTGTHPLWHVLNAVVLYALVATAIRHRETAG
ncbi:hypothetical protein CTI14_43455 [Methylobacterium radiotolerans]|nr:hypothetical protein CTI14_43455 [Methylobacterium radiotolerans]